MEFTLDILEYTLREVCTMRRKGAVDGTRPIRAILFWDGADDRDGILYLAPEGGVSGKNILCVGTEPSGASGAWLDCASEERQRCCNAVLCAFSDFLEWRRVLELAAETDHDIRRVIARSAEFLGARINIVNRIFQDLTPMDRAADGVYLEITDVQQLYLRNPNFEETFQSRGITAYEFNRNRSERQFYYNIFYRDAYLARLLISVPLEMVRPGLQPMLALLGETVEICYTYFYKTKLTGSHAQRDYDQVTRLLSGKTLTHGEEDALLHSLGWEKNGLLQVVYFQPTNRLDSETMLTYQSVRFETLFNRSLCMSYRDGLVCLAYFTSEAEQHRMREKLPYILREDLCRAGVSCTFRGVSKLGVHARQAQDALRLGSRINPSNWCFYFEDLSWDYMLDQCTREYSAEDLAHPALRQLAAYDAQHPDIGLNQTLFTYLACGCNASAAAQALYIHRTTLLARLERIRELTSLDLRSWTERMRLMVSFALRAQESQEQD